MLAQVNIGTEFFKGAPGSAGRSFQYLPNISIFISMFLRGAFSLAGIILLFYFISAGVAMIGSAGKNDPKAQEQAKATITSALTGFVVVFTAYWIVKLIGTLFGVPDII